MEICLIALSAKPAPKKSLSCFPPTLQENNGILTDIPTENEILGISRGISSEYTDGILRKYQSVGIFRGNSEQKWVPRKKTDEFRGKIIAVGEPLGDFTKFQGNSDELAFSVEILSEFPRSVGRI
ncbi:hypothetical protein F2Q69_00052195 [Brassica cretica]|uniref:Uncharacterized protein n=1 Tax=Brassica cretica TaxID=69181 RepID=A0A8S9N4G1_BRACR|nr:hypothetical protein F2Q69_00052195 [Brassica cretica]